jgi:hypothetical protein
MGTRDKKARLAVLEKAQHRLQDCPICKPKSRTRNNFNERYRLIAPTDLIDNVMVNLESARGIVFT